MRQHRLGQHGDDNIVWGNAEADNIVWGNVGSVDNIVWGNSAGDEDIIVGQLRRRRRVLRRRHR